MEAEELRPGSDPATAVRAAAERGASALGMAGGDGSLGAVAAGERERLDEGLLHVYVIEAVGRRALLALLARAVRGRPEVAEGLVEWTAASLRVELERPRAHAAVDGEPVVLEPPLELELRPRALRVLVPAGV